MENSTEVSDTRAGANNLPGTLAKSRVVLGIVLILVFALMACASDVSGVGSGNAPLPSNAIVAAHDLESASDERDLVQQAHIIVVGQPVGDIETVPPKRVGSPTKYYQNVRVSNILKGVTAEETLRVVQFGIDRGELDQFEKAKDVGVFIEDADRFPGPLSQRPQILFLQETPTGAFSVVGMNQGAFLLGADGRVESAQGFKSFEGLSVPEVKQRIAELSRAN